MQNFGCMTVMKQLFRVNADGYVVVSAFCGKLINIDILSRHNNASNILHYVRVDSPYAKSVRVGKDFHFSGGVICFALSH